MRVCKAGENDVIVCGLDSHTGGMSLGRTWGFFTAAGMDSFL